MAVSRGKLRHLQRRKQGAQDQSGSHRFPLRFDRFTPIMFRTVFGEGQVGSRAAHVSKEDTMNSPDALLIPLLMLVYNGLG